MTDHRDHWEALFDSTYLRWFNLCGEPALVEITSVKREELTLRGGVKKVAPVIGLKQVQGKIDHLKPLVLNKTNAETIAGFCGSAVKEWKGRQIVLFPTICQLQGKDKDCIRIRKPKQTSS